MSSRSVPPPASSQCADEERRGCGNAVPEPSTVSLIFECCLSRIGRRLSNVAREGKTEARGLTCPRGLRYIFADAFQTRRAREGQHLMQGVVSLLDDRHYARVQAIWEELGQKFNVRGMYVTPYPHFSLQVAEQYEEEACESYLRSLAARTRPFRVRTAGLGIFTVANPILYIPVVRSPRLSELHRELWCNIKQRTPGAVAHYYHPDEWSP